MLSVKDPAVMVMVPIILMFPVNVMVAEARLMVRLVKPFVTPGKLTLFAAPSIVMDEVVPPVKPPPVLLIKRWRVSV